MSETPVDLPSSPDEHRTAAAGLSVRFALLTLSDTRTAANDFSGNAMADLVTKGGHRVARRSIIADDAAALTRWLEAQLADDEVDALVTSGGTGVAGRDVTVPVVMRFLAPSLPGFGELFRMLSFEQVGPAAMLSQAAGGVARHMGGHGKPLFALPGSTKAVELGLARLILPEIAHLCHELRRQRS